MCAFVLGQQGERFGALSNYMVRCRCRMNSTHGKAKRARERERGRPAEYFSPCRCSGRCVWATLNPSICRWLCAVSQSREQIDIREEWQAMMMMRMVRRESTSKKKANGGAEAEQRHMQAENREEKVQSVQSRAARCVSHFFALHPLRLCEQAAHLTSLSSSIPLLRTAASSSHRISALFFFFSRDVSKELEQLAIDGWKRDDDDDSSGME